MESNNLIQSRRSFIFTPGLKPEMFPKAIKSGTDMVCVELEDGIAPQDKNLARKLAIKLFETKQNDDGIERILRINSLREKFGIDDVQAILYTKTPPPALMIPKVKSSEEIVLLDSLLTEKRHNCRLHIIIETNEGLEKAYEIANCSNRIDALFFGGVDMSAELRCENTWEPLLYARSRIVHAASSAGIDAIDVPYLDLDDYTHTWIVTENYLRATGRRIGVVNMLTKSRFHLLLLEHKFCFCLYHFCCSHRLNWSKTILRMRGW